MIFRFSLYGFLKNLRFFEAFLVLALRERGMGFLEIGSLIAVREVTTHLLEIPSGAVADAWGRKVCMVASMAAYVGCFLLLGSAGSFTAMAMAMVCYGLGDAFRSGTHKAMIYSWLREQGRESERTQVYGYTRSWSKIGSGVSALIAAGLVIFSGNYASVFYWSAVPAFLNLVNLVTYPASLDAGCHGFKRGIWRAAFVTLADAFREIRKLPVLRRLVGESVAMEGGYEAMKDYLQPVLQTAALTLPFLYGQSDLRRTALVTGVVYALVFFAGSLASRRAHVWESWCGGSVAATSRLRMLTALLMALLLPALLYGLPWVAAGIFVVMGLLQNLWRPIQVGRFDEHGSEGVGATLLSVESQAKSMAAAFWAPLLGAMIDVSLNGTGAVPTAVLWPICLPLIVILLSFFRKGVISHPP